MSARPEHRPTRYEQLERLPDRLTGEIIDGPVHAHPRPRASHVLATLRLGADLDRPYGRGRGGPGGWWLLAEPEVHFVLDREVAVPDLAGWHRSRLPVLPASHEIDIGPAWIGELLSPSTRSVDRELEMPLHARHGVVDLWLLDPGAHTLETFRLRDGEWSPGGTYRGGRDGVHAALRSRAHPPCGALELRTRSFRPRVACGDARSPSAASRHCAPASPATQ